MRGLSSLCAPPKTLAVRRALLVFLCCVLCFDVPKIGGVSVPVSCVAGAQTFGSSAADYLLSSCNQPTMTLTVTAANSFTSTSSTLQGVTFSFTGASIISLFSVVISGSKISSAGQSLLMFSMPLKESSIVISAASTLTTNGVATLAIISVAGTSQSLTVGVDASTLSGTGPLLSFAGGTFGSSNAISLGTTTLTGVGPVLSYGGVLSSTLTMVKTVLTLSSATACVAATTSSAQGFTFAGSWSSATPSCGGSLFSIAGASVQTTLSIASTAAVGFTWTVASTAGVLTLSGTSTQTTLFMDSVTMTTGYLVATTTTATSMALTLRGTSLTMNHAGNTGITLGNAAAVHSLGLDFGPSTTTGITATTITCLLHSFMVALYSVDPFTITMSKTTISSVVSIFSVPYFGTTSVSMASCTVTCGSGGLLTGATLAASPFAVILSSTSISSSTSHIFNFASLIGSSGHTFVLDSCTFSATSKYLFSFTGFQPSLDISLISSSFAGAGLITMAAGGTLATVTYRSSQSSCTGHCFAFGAASGSLAVTMQKASGSAVASTLTTTGGAILSATSFTVGVSWMATDASKISAVGTSSAMFACSGAVATFFGSFSVTTTITVNTAQHIFSFPATSAVLSVASGSLLQSSSGGILLLSSSVTLALSVLQSTCIALSFFCSVAGSVLSPGGGGASSMTVNGASFSGASWFFAVSGDMQWSSLSIQTTSIVASSAILSSAGAMTIASGTVAGSTLKGTSFVVQVGSVATLSLLMSSSAITATSQAIFSVPSAAATGHSIALSLTQVAVEAPGLLSGTLLAVGGSASALSVSTDTCTFGATSPFAAGIISVAGSVGSLTLAMSATTVTTGSTAAYVFTFGTITSTSSLTFSSTTFSTSGSASNWFTCTGLSGTAHTVVASSLSITSGGGAFLTYSGTVAPTSAPLSISCSSCFIKSGSGFSFSQGVQGLNVTLAATTLSLTGSVFTMGDASSAVGVTVVGSSASAPAVVSSGGSFLMIDAVVIAVYDSVSVSVSAVALTLAGNAISVASSVILTTNPSFSFSSISGTMASSLLYCAGSATDTALTLSSSVITVGSSGPLIGVPTTATLIRCSWMVASTTITGPTALLSMAAASVSSLGFTVTQTTALLTTTASYSGAVALRGAAGSSDSSTSISLVSSAISMTSTGAILGTIYWSLFLVTGGGLHSSLRLRSISTAFSPSYSSGSFSTTFAHVTGAGTSVSGTGSLFDVSSTTVTTTTVNKQVILAESGTTMQGATISVNCLSWSYITGILVQLDGVADTTSVTTNSVYLYKTAGSAIIRYSNAASVANSVAFYDSKFFAPALVGATSSSQVHYVYIGCSWYGNDRMTVGSLSTLLQFRGVVVPCTRLYHPSCWTTKSPTASASPTWSIPVTFSRQSLSNTLTATVSNSTRLTVTDSPTTSQTLSAHVSLTPSRSVTASQSAAVSATSTLLPTASASTGTSSSKSLSGSVTPSTTASLSTSASASSSNSASLTSTLSPTESPTGEASITGSVRSLSTDRTLTASPVTLSDGHSASATASATDSLSLSPSAGSLTAEATPSASSSASATLSGEPTRSLRSITWSLSVTASRTLSVTRSISALVSRTASVSRTSSPVLSVTDSLTTSVSPSSTASAARTQTNTKTYTSDLGSRSTSLSSLRSRSASRSVASPTASKTPSVRTKSPSASLSRKRSASRSSSVSSSGKWDSSTQSASFSALLGSATASTSQSLSRSGYTPSRSAHSLTSVLTATDSRPTPSPTAHESASAVRASRSRLPSRSNSSLVSQSQTRSSTFVASKTRSLSRTASQSPLTGSSAASRTESRVSPAATRTPSKRTQELSASRSASESLTPSETPSGSFTDHRTVTLNSPSGTASQQPKTATASLSGTAWVKSRSHTVSGSHTRSIVTSLSPTTDASQTQTVLRRTKTHPATPSPSQNARSLTTTNTTTPSFRLTAVPTSTLVGSITHHRFTKSQTPSDIRTRTAESVSQTPGTHTMPVTLTEASEHLSRTASYSTTFSPRRQAILVSATHFNASLTVTATATLRISTSLSYGTAARTKSVDSASATVSENGTETRTLQLTETEWVTPSPSSSLGVTKPTHLLTLSETFSATFSRCRKRKLQVRGAAGENGNHADFLGNSATMTQTESVSASEFLASATRTQTITLSDDGRLNAQNALGLHRLSAYQKTVASDCFRGAMAILLPMAGLVVGIIALNYFVLCAEVAVYDGALRVSLFRCWCANHLYISFLRPCHQRCVVLHGVEVVAHVCVVVCAFATLFYFVHPSSVATKWILGAAAVVAAGCLRSFSSRVGWWYRGRAELRLRAEKKGQHDEVFEPRSGSAYLAATEESQHSGVVLDINENDWDVSTSTAAVATRRQRHLSQEEKGPSTPPQEVVAVAHDDALFDPQRVWDDADLAALIVDMDFVSSDERPTHSSRGSDKNGLRRSAVEGSGALPLDGDIDLRSADGGPSSPQQERQREAPEMWRGNAKVNAPASLSVWDAGVTSDEGDVALDLMSLPASLFRQRTLSYGDVESPAGFGDSSGHRSPSPKLQRRKVSSWFHGAPSAAAAPVPGGVEGSRFDRRFPLGGYSEEVDGDDGSGSSVDLQHIVEMVEFQRRASPLGRDGGSGGGRDDDLTLSDKKPSVNTPTSTSAASRKGKRQQQWRIALPLASPRSPTQSRQLIDNLQFIKHDDSADDDGELSSRGSIASMGIREDLNSYWEAYAANIVLLLASFAGAFVLVSRIANAYSCDDFSTSVALAVFGFDALVVQAAYASFVCLSLWRHRLRKEHVWKLHPR